MVKSTPRQIAEDAINKGSLILVDGVAGAGGGVRPVHLVGLANLHFPAVLENVGRGKLRIISIVVVAAEAKFLF